MANIVTSGTPQEQPVLQASCAAAELQAGETYLRLDNLIAQKGLTRGRWGDRLPKRDVRVRVGGVATGS